MRRVFITGGSRGIGAACVRRFASAGDSVVFTYNKNKDAAEALALEIGAECLQSDISISSKATEAVERAAELMGGIDVLVNNAGIAQIKLFTDLCDDDWSKMIGVNLSGAFYVTRAAAKYMIRKHKGRIVNIGSVWGNHGASCEVHYSAAKAGIRGMTRALAKELGPSGITVNCVEPGVIDTEMNSSLDEATRLELADETPLCRLGRAEEVAETVFFLASDGASFITAQIIGVDGGFGV